VQGVEDPERGDDAHDLGGIEPRGRHRDVERPAHLAFGLVWDAAESKNPPAATRYSTTATANVRLRVPFMLHPSVKTVRRALIDPGPGKVPHALLPRSLRESKPIESPAEFVYGTRMPTFARAAARRSCSSTGDTGPRSPGRRTMRAERPAPMREEYRL